VSWGRRGGPARHHHGHRLLLKHDIEHSTDAEEAADAVAFAHGAPLVEGCVFDGFLFGSTDLAPNVGGQSMWVYGPQVLSTMQAM